MIINTGSRTDIPAFYSEWFYNRIKEGYVMTRNPYYPLQVLRYRLVPEVVDCLMFCTKNPQPMLDRMEEIKQFGQFWHVTITPYGKEIEPNVPDKNIVMDSLKKLSEQVGIQAVGWRYDPIFISEKYSLDFHIQAFEQMAENLSGYVEYCVISFIDLYVKTKRNFSQVKAVTRQEQDILAEAFVRIGKKYKIAIKSCCEREELAVYGIDTSGCMTQPVIERAIGCSLNVTGARKPVREGCSCLLGNDIGMYNTCDHACVYCYANYDRQTVVQNRRLHDPRSPFLIGGFREDDVVKDAKQASWCDGQMVLPFLKPCK